MFKMSKKVLIISIFLAVGFSVNVDAVRAQEMPGAPESSPGVYKVLAENDIMRVLLATWEPGERDEWHGHPPSSVFYVTDCLVRAFFPDGSQRDIIRKKDIGRARDKSVKSHSIQNIGNTECKILLVEFKGT